MAKSINLLNHLGGLKTNLSPFLYKPTETPNALNVRNDTILGALTKATGYAQYGSDAGATAIQGVMPLEAPDGTKKLFMATNGVVYEDVAATWTSRVTSLSASAKFDSTVLYDQLWVANGVDAVRYTTNGTTWDAASASWTGWVDAGSAGSIQYAPKFVDAFRNKLYCANFGTSYRNQWTVSESGDGKSSYDGNTDIDGDITALKSTLNYQFFFTEQSLWRYDETYLMKIDSIGTPAHRSVQAGAGRLFFANRDGVWQTDGSKPQLISRPVQYWIDGIATANLTSLNATYYQHEYYLWIGTSHDTANVVLVYNTLYQTWRVLTGWPSACMATWTNASNEQHLYLGNNTTDSLVFQSSTGYQAAGTTLSATYDYPVLFPAGPDKEFSGVSLHCFAEAAGPVVFTLQYALDGADTFTTLTEWQLTGLGFPEHARFEVPTSLRGRSIQWRITESTATVAWKWHGLKFYYEPGPGSRD